MEPGPNPKVYPNYVEFDAVPAQGGILCTNAKWKSFDGASSGTFGYVLDVVVSD